MSKILRLISLYLFFLLSFTELIGQTTNDSTIIWQIITNDDNEYVGLILKRTDQQIQLKTNKIGIININTTDIHSIKPIDTGKIVGSEVWGDNPQATRYFWAPNAFSLKKGEGYYQNVSISFNQVSVGVTDNFTLGLGTVPLFLFAGASTPVWITPKITFPMNKDNFNLGIGALAATVIGEKNTNFGIAYGVATFGNRDKNFNIGLGYGYAGDDWANSPTITLSGMVRTGKKGYFITENYFLDTGDGTLMLLSAGGRTVWRKLSLDYGGFIPISSEINTFIVIPWLGLVVPFGQ